MKLRLKGFEEVWQLRWLKVDGLGCQKLIDAAAVHQKRLDAAL